MLNSNERIIKHKIGPLNLAEELGNISQACKMMGLSRDTFYRHKEAVDEGGVQALLDKSRKNPTRRTMSMSSPKRLFSNMPLNILPMASCAPAMNSGN